MRPGGSSASLPVYRVDGNVVALETLKPSAMFPTPSIATLPIQR